MRKRIFDIIQIGNKEDRISRGFDILIAAVIMINVVTMYLETFASLSMFSGIFRVIEIVTVTIFCVEYLLRIWTADYLYPHVGPWKARGKFLCSFEGIVDLLTILPFFYLSGFVAFRILRVVRIFHLFRINNQYDSFHVIVDVLYEKRNQIISSMVIVVILMLASSLGMYSAEHEAQPEAFANAFSGIWWSVAALLTIGYGDLYPITVMGRIMAIITAFLGVGVVAIPTGIISAGFVEKYTKEKYADLSFHDIHEIGEVLVSAGHLFEGKIVEEIREVYSTQILVVLRGELTVVASPKLRICEGDILVVKSEQMEKHIEGKEKKEGKDRNGTRRTKRK